MAKKSMSKSAKAARYAYSKSGQQVITGRTGCGTRVAYKKGRKANDAARLAVINVELPLALAKRVAKAIAKSNGWSATRFAEAVKKNASKKSLTVPSLKGARIQQGFRVSSATRRTVRAMSRRTGLTITEVVAALCEKIAA